MPIITRYRIEGSSKYCFVDEEKKQVLFESEVEYGKVNEVAIFEKGLHCGLSAAGGNFMYGHVSITQEEFEEKLKNG